MKKYQLMTPVIRQAFQYDDYLHTKEQQDKMSKLFREHAITIERDNQHEQDGSISFPCWPKFRAFRGDWIIIHGFGTFQVLTDEEFKKEYAEVIEVTSGI